MKGTMLAEVSWSTGRSTLTSGWNSSAMPGDIRQQGSLSWGKSFRRGRSRQPVKMPSGSVQMENWFTCALQMPNVVLCSQTKYTALKDSFLALIPFSPVPFESQPPTTALWRGPGPWISQTGVDGSAALCWTQSESARAGTQLQGAATLPPVSLLPGIIKSKSQLFFAPPFHVRISSEALWGQWKSQQKRCFYFLKGQITGDTLLL